MTVRWYYIWGILVAGVYGVVRSVKKSLLPNNQKIQMMKNAKIIVDCIGWFLFLVLSLWYIIKLYNSV